MNFIISKKFVRACSIVKEKHQGFIMGSGRRYVPLLEVEGILGMLHKVSLFGGLSDRQLYTVFRILEGICYLKGERIFQQGGQPEFIYIVRSGQVKMVMDIDFTPFELVAFGEGQCFGESSLIGIQNHSATAFATEDTDLLVLSNSALMEIFNKDKELYGILILNIAREACRRLHQCENVALHYAIGH